ncbi:hypothetical protein FACS189454_02400 [Planctomycetales bacterium]|nr:hypothetical protein FACS189454_02400 [Planctomycetales bacterium]
MYCLNAQRTGRKSPNGYSDEITCPHSRGNSAADCSPRCPFFATDHVKELEDYYRRIEEVRLALCGSCGSEERVSYK